MKEIVKKRRLHYTPVKLSYDLEEEILSWVPFKSLARFRCVCKFWNTLSLEDRFLQKNFSHTQSYGGEHRFIILDNCGRASSVGIKEQQNMVDHLPPLMIEDLSLNKVLSVKKQNLSPIIKVFKIEHCEGLLLCVMDHQLLVWNPLLKETRWIKCSCEFRYYDDAYSLGYVNNRDYRIIRFRCPTNVRRSRSARVEVYKFASKTWKVIDIVFDWILRSPLLMLSLSGTPYCIGLRKQVTKKNKAFLQSFDFSKERFQPIDNLPFRYDPSNPLGLEIFGGDRVSVLEQCHKTRKICVWVKHWLMIPSWSRLLVVDIPHFPLLHPRVSRFATNYLLDKNGRLVVTVAKHGIVNICRVIGESELQTIGKVKVDGYHSSCKYVPSLFKLPGFSKQDTSRIRWRRNRFD